MREACASAARHASLLRQGRTLALFCFTTLSMMVLSGTVRSAKPLPDVSLISALMDAEHTSTAREWEQRLWLHPAHTRLCEGRTSTAGSCAWSSPSPPACCPRGCCPRRRLRRRARVSVTSLFVRRDTQHSPNKRRTHRAPPPTASTHPAARRASAPARRRRPRRTSSAQELHATDARKSAPPPRAA